jgi:hypothetical protein
MLKKEKGIKVMYDEMKRFLCKPLKVLASLRGALVIA